MGDKRKQDIEPAVDDDLQTQMLDGTIVHDSTQVGDAGDDQTVVHETVVDEVAADENTVDIPHRNRETVVAGDDQTIDVPAEDRTGIHHSTAAEGATQKDGNDRTVDFSSRDRDSFEIVDEPAAKKRRSLVGKSIGGYEVLSELGRGGMGVVYKAREKKLGRLVALKMILSGSHAGKDTILRFMREARAVANLQHPNIVQLFEVSEDSGLPYFSLEFVEGQCLDDMFKENPASPKQAAQIVVALAEAMQYAHNEGIIHRDLKPANVLMTKNAEPKITDFGLAKQVSEDDGQTKSGTILGTPGYMSPEQASGMVKEMTPAADQYSLGAVLYWLIAGRAPFVSSRAMDTIMQVIKCDPVPLQQLSSEVPIDLETICLKTLSKDPAARYADCQALADDLRRFINHEPIVARPISTLEKLTRWCRRNPKIASLLGVTFCLLLTIAGLMTWSSFAIGKERDLAKIQEQKAKDNLVVAIENEERAEANAILAQENEERAKQNEEIAKEQALKIVKTMQNVLTEIDAPLRENPNFAQTRLDIMKALSDTYNDLEIELHTDVKSQAIPTFMAIRYNLVQIFQSLNEGKLAHEEIKRVYELGKERIKIKEGTDAARSNLVKIGLVHATITEKAEGIEASKPLLDEALEVARDIIEHPKPSEEPGTPPTFELQYLLSNALQSVGVYHYNSGDLANAAVFFKEAGDVRNDIATTVADDEEFKAKPENYQQGFLNSVKIDARRSKLGAATVLFKTGQADAGIEQFESVIESVRKEFEQDPTDRNELEVGKMEENFGFSCFKVGQIDRASELLKSAETITAKFAQKNPEDYDSQYTHSVSLYRYGTVLEAQNQDQSKNRFAKCVEIREKLAEKDPNLKNETMLMVAYARNGNAEKAIEIADRLNKNDELEGKMRIDIARAYVQAARFVDGDDNKDLLVQKGLAAIQQAIVGGYSDWFELQTEPDLKPVQDNEAFVAMLEKLKAQ